MLHRGTLLAGQSGSGSEDRKAPRESERAQGALQFKDGLRRVNTKKGPVRSVGLPLPQAGVPASVPRHLYGELQLGRTDH